MVPNETISADDVITSQMPEWTTPGLDCGLPPGECDVLRTILAVIYSITIVVEILTIACIIILRKYKFFHQRIFCHLLICNLLTGIVFLSDLDNRNEDGTPNCTAQGFFIQMFDFTQFMWICALTVFLFNQLVRGKNTARYEWLYTLVCWVLPLSIACLPLMTDDYGQANAPYCWIKGTPSGTVWRFVVFWVPVLGGLVVVLVVFIYMIWRATRDMKHYKGAEDQFTNTHRRLVRDYLRPLTAYAAAFVFLHLLQFINRVQNIAGDPLLELVALHMTCLSVYGIVLCTLFVITTGKQEFALQKFKDGIKYYKHLVKSCGEKESVIIDYPVSEANTSLQTPNAQRRDRPKLRVSVVDATDDSGVERGDIRSESLDTISLDSDTPGVVS